MSNFSKLYKEVFEKYGLSHANEEQKSPVRSYIKRSIQKCFPKSDWKNNPGTSWDSLPQDEKDYFIYFCIAEDMISKYVPKTNATKIKKKIDDVVNKKSFLLQRQLSKENEIRKHLMEDYQKEYPNDYQKEAAYNAFCEQINNISPYISCPTYKQWCSNSTMPSPINTESDYLEPIRKNTKKKTEESKKEFPCPERIYDYVQDYQVENNIHIDSSLAQTHSVLKTHILIRTIINVLDKEFGIKINADAIDEALSFLEEYDDVPEDELLLEYNPELELPKNNSNSNKSPDSKDGSFLSKEEQEKIIFKNRQYIKYKNMIKESDFYTIEKNKRK